MAPFRQYKQWMIDRYGEPLFRIPVQLASSCPHGRCAFCSEDGAKAQQTQQQESPFEQIEAAIQFSKRRYKAQKLMLYIQAFTADLTHPVQQEILFQCLEQFDFTAISIGTRPDCLPEAALNFLEKLKEQVEVWVELGVQTTNDETLQRIHRGHDWACSRQAIIELAERGIHVAPHIILGLPNEAAGDWIRTAEEMAALPLSGIKIHNLHIMKGTELADQYAAAPFPLLNHWEYAEGLMDFLRIIPADIPVMRISTDTPDDQLIAPHWHLEKGQFLDYVVQQMGMREITQGDLRNDGMKKQWNTEKPNIPTLQNSNIPVITADGSVTFFSEDWKEHYHTKTGARLEAEKKFVEPSGLSLKLKRSDVKLLDVCFGLGNNSLAAICEADALVCRKSAGEGACATGNISITALEMDKRIVRAAASMFQPLENDPVDWPKTLSKLLDGEVVFPKIGTIDLRFGDARWLVQNLADDSFDIVFHDPFSSQHCPELWTVEFFRQLHRVMKPNGVLLTYSSAAPVRGAMREAGFHIAETVPGHQMGNGTIAAKQGSTIKGLVGQASLYLESLCSSDEQENTRSRIREACPTTEKRRLIPYRDEHLCATSRAILRQRQEAVESM